jgi:hypothetical protein
LSVSLRQTNLCFLSGILKNLLETAQLAALDLDPVGVAVFRDIFFMNLELSGDPECLRAGDALLDPFSLECLFDLVSVHGNNIVCTSS